jgi:hypothetical protein
MKTSFYSKTMIAWAVAIAAAAGTITQAQDQPMPPPAGDSALPPGVDPNTPLAQVVKLAQAGVDESIIKNYILNSPGAFNLDTDKIITLKDVGVPTDVVNAMMDRDKVLYLANVSPPPPAPAPEAPPATTDTAPPAEPVTVNYFNDSLTPYGSWVVVEGYGRCWRPTTVIYDSGWRPYCDRGHWVYTDCGWYWDSDYAWGVTFHYGRWFRHDRFGWCWYPDTEWAPSWVTWRSSSDYCGWAPLPPLAVYRPGAGFFYRGASVAVSFDFGLRADCFTFVSPDRFCEQHPRRFCVEPARVPQVFGRTTVINNFDVHNTFVVNNGIDVARIPGRDHHPIQPIHVGSLPNAGRQGWRGGGDGNHPGQHAVGNNNNNPGHTVVNGGGNGQPDHGAVVHDGRNNDGNHQGAANGGQGNSHPGNWNGGQTVNHGVGSPYVAPAQQTPRYQGNNNGQGNQNGQHQQGVSNGNGQHTQAGAPAGSMILNGPARGTTPTATAPPVVTPAPAHNEWQSAGNNYNNNGGSAGIHPRSSTEMPAQQQQQFQQRQERFNQPVVTAPPARGAPQLETRQYVAPSQPVVTERSQPYAESRQVHVEAAQPVQHSAPQVSAPAQTQSQSRESDRGSGNDKKDR